MGPALVEEARAALAAIRTSSPFAKADLIMDAKDIGKINYAHSTSTSGENYSEGTSYAMSNGQDFRREREGEQKCMYINLGTSSGRHLLRWMHISTPLYTAFEFIMQ